jgi:dynein assembly factor 1
MRRFREMTEPDRDEQGRKIITEAYVKKLCSQNHQYETPRLNTQLYLHYQGFCDIRNLDNYVAVRALWLENNLISKIQNLDKLKSLKFLNLQNNNITKIEGLDQLTELSSLNLGNNRISKVENLACCIKLEDLNLSYNQLSDPNDLQKLNEVKSLTSLDLSHNYIHEPDGLVEVFSELTNLGCLYLRGNKAPHKISNYRKVMIVKIPSLKYLDERPVFEVERLGAEAWFEHGKDAEMAVRRKYYEDKEAEQRRNLRLFQRTELEAMKKKHECRKKIEQERMDKRIKIAEERKKILQEQQAHMEAMLEELDRREKELDQPIDEDSFIEPAMPKGKIVVRTGEYDAFGNPVELKEDDEKEIIEDIIVAMKEEKEGIKDQSILNIAKDNTTQEVATSNTVTKLLIHEIEPEDIAIEESVEDILLPPQTVLIESQPPSPPKSILKPSNHTSKNFISPSHSTITSILKPPSLSQFSPSRAVQSSSSDSEDSSPRHKIIDLSNLPDIKDDDLGTLEDNTLDELD